MLTLMSRKGRDQMKSNAAFRMMARVRSDLPIRGTAWGFTRSGEDSRLAADTASYNNDTVSVCKPLLPGGMRLDGALGSSTRRAVVPLQDCRLKAVKRAQCASRSKPTPRRPLRSGPRLTVPLYSNGQLHALREPGSIRFRIWQTHTLLPRTPYLEESCGISRRK